MLSSESSTYSFDLTFSAFFDFDWLHVFVMLLLVTVVFFVDCVRDVDHARDAFGSSWTSLISMLESEVGSGGFERFGGLSASDSSLPGDTTCILRFEGSGRSFLG